MSDFSTHNVKAMVIENWLTYSLRIVEAHTEMFSSHCCLGTFFLFPFQVFGSVSGFTVYVGQPDCGFTCVGSVSGLVMS